MLRYDPKLVHYHPSILLPKLKQVIQGAEGKFLKASTFKKDRELFFACLFAYAIRKITERECFIQSIPEGQDPPDFELLSASNRPLKEKPFDNALIEIVEVPTIIEKKSSPILEALLNLENSKLASSIYDDYMILVISHTRFGPRITEALEQRILTIPRKNKSVSIWSMYFNDINPKDSFLYTVTEIIPGNKSVQLSLNGELRKGFLFDHPYYHKFGQKILKE